MDLRLEGKVAVITGGSQGIGKATALELARNGVDVALVARGKPALYAAAAEIADVTGRRALGFSGDMGSADDIRRVVKQAADAFGRIDILLNAASRVGGDRSGDHLTWPATKLAGVRTSRSTGSRHGI